ncbi:hypothetical protein SUT007_14220 [Streptococcus parasuis]|nr:hypothetical protein SUT007_14220 [Streptococcus parasuis]
MGTRTYFENLPVPINKFVTKSLLSPFDDVHANQIHRYSYKIEKQTISYFLTIQRYGHENQFPQQNVKHPQS